MRGPKRTASRKLRALSVLAAHYRSQGLRDHEARTLRALVRCAPTSAEAARARRRLASLAR